MSEIMESVAWRPVLAPESRNSLCRSRYHVMGPGKEYRVEALVIDEALREDEADMSGSKNRPSTYEHNKEVA